MSRFKEAKSQIEVGEKAFSASEQALAGVAEGQRDDSLFHAACSAIETGFQEIRDSYSDLASPWKRKAVRVYLATDPMVQKVEGAVSRHILLVRTAPTRAGREESARKVREGMEFWKRLILKKMEA